MFSDTIDEARFWLIVSGNPVHGFKYYGPFESSEAAIKVAEKFLHSDFMSDEWWVTELESTKEIIH